MTVRIYKVDDESCEMCPRRSGIRRIEFKTDSHTFSYTMCQNCRKALLDALYDDMLYTLEGEE